MTSINHLLLVDPQNDFCDLPPDWQGRQPSGEPLLAALPVAGAHADMLRTAAFIEQASHLLQAITVTLDSHHRIDIAHPAFWQHADGSAVAPFTPITAAQVRFGTYAPRLPQDLPRTLAYLDALEARLRYTLMVWPVHCEIGSWGHNVHPAVRLAYNLWETAHQSSVYKVMKGSNPWTEHYSALQAEVPDPADPHTLLNTELLNRLNTADVLLVAGEASSHCVRATVHDIIDHWPGGRPERVILLTDAMSPVAGFEAQHQEFLQHMSARGVRSMRCEEALVMLRKG